MNEEKLKGKKKFSGSDTKSLRKFAKTSPKVNFWIQIGKISSVLINNGGKLFSFQGVKKKLKKNILFLLHLPKQELKSTCSILLKDRKGLKIRTGWFKDLMEPKPEKFDFFLN